MEEVTLYQKYKIVEDAIRDVLRSNKTVCVTFDSSDINYKGPILADTKLIYFELMAPTVPEFKINKNQLTFDFIKTQNVVQNIVIPIESIVRVFDSDDGNGELWFDLQDFRVIETPRDHLTLISCSEDIESEKSKAKLKVV